MIKFNLFQSYSAMNKLGRAYGPLKELMMRQNEMRECRRKRQHGFTLVELLVVIAILGILAGLVVPRIMEEPDKARVVKAKMQMESIGTALNQYRLDNGVYPDTAQGLNALVEKPTSGRIPRNYPTRGYMDVLPLDPWDNEFIYVQPGEHGDYDLTCLGADGMPGGEGVDKDINNWDEKERRK